MEINFNFFCIGGTKCGTTTLHDILIQHPEIYLPKIKETKFFSLNYSKGIDWYKKEYFSSYNNETIAGEVYPCMNLETSPMRIYESFGKDVKIIGILRNPANRAYSNYLAQKRLLKHNISFEKALVNKNFSYLINKSLYAQNISRFLEYFPIENMKFFIFETDFILHREKMISEIFNFLNIPQFPLNMNIRSNAAWKPRSQFLDSFLYHRSEKLTRIIKILFPSELSRQRIRKFIQRSNSKNIKSPRLNNNQINAINKNYFSNDIKKLESLINRNLSIWYK